MSPIRGRKSFLFRLVAIPVAGLLASHLVFYRRFPTEVDYQFPWPDFLTIASIMVACWEANLWVFRFLDRRLPFHQHPLRRIGWQVLAGGIVTTITFALMLTLISAILSHEVPSTKMYATGLLICFTIATIINGIYVGFYLIHVIYWQEQQSAEQLNHQLAEQQHRLAHSDAKRNAPLTVLPAPSEAVPVRPARTGILIHIGNQLQQLQPDEIAYIYSSGGLVQLVRTDGRVFTTNYDSLAALDGQLPRDYFFQINRQFIVHLNAVQTVRDDVNRKLIIHLVPALPQQQTDKGVIISRYRSAEFRQWLSRVGRR